MKMISENSSAKNYIGKNGEKMLTNITLNMKVIGLLLYQDVTYNIKMLRIDV